MRIFQLIAIISLLILTSCNNHNINDKMGIDSRKETECSKRTRVLRRIFTPKKDEDTITKFVNIINTNLNKNIKLVSNLNSMTKNFKYNLNEISIYDNDGDLVGGISINLYIDTVNFWKIFIDFGDNVIIKNAQRAIDAFLMNKADTSQIYRKVINECLEQTDYCILQVQFDWKKYLEKLKKESPEDYKEMKRKYDEIKKEYKNK